MARAIEQQMVVAQPESDGSYVFDFEVSLMGPDVFGGAGWSGLVRTNLVGTDTLATFEAKRANAIRAEATAMGITVPANMILLLVYKAG